MVNRSQFSTTMTRIWSGPYIPPKIHPKIQIDSDNHPPTHLFPPINLQGFHLGNLPFFDSDSEWWMFYSKINQLLFHLQKSKLDLPGTRAKISTKRRPRLLSITRTFGAGIFKAQPCEETAILRQGWKDSDLLVIWFTGPWESNLTVPTSPKKEGLTNKVYWSLHNPKAALISWHLRGVGPLDSYELLSNWTGPTHLCKVISL